jgi:uncharacterized membrane protein YccF (DUF307 family)
MIMLNLLSDTVTVIVTTTVTTTVTIIVTITVTMTVTLYVITNFSFWLFGPLAYGTVYFTDSVNIHILLSNSFLQLNMSQSMS